MNNNNNNNNDDDNNNANAAPPMMIPDNRMIQDFDSWLQRNSLRSMQQLNENNNNQHLSERNNREAKKRVREHEKYQEFLHKEFFGDAEEKEQDELAQRTHVINSFASSTIDILVANGEITGVPLKPLALSCDTVLALVSSWHHFSNENDNENNEKPLQLSLEQYSQESVQEFLKVIHQQIELKDISPAYIIDCCQIAHYLQNQPLVDQIVNDILLQSIDNANCMSLCELADQLHLPLLFERSLSHMLQTLGKLEETEAYQHLNAELKSRIEMIQTAIQTSIFNKKKQSPLYFGSLEEYVAIFAENVQYHRERLQEAKERQREMTLEENVAISRPRGNAWYDAQSKIERQEIRVQTLETAYREQKKVFLKTHANTATTTTTNTTT